MNRPNSPVVIGNQTNTMMPWHAAWTYARQEKALVRQLEGLGFHCLLPLRSEAREYAGVPVRVEVPILPGCVFLQGTRTAVVSALATGRVRRVTELPLELCALLPRDVQTELQLGSTH